MYTYLTKNLHSKVFWDNKIYKKTISFDERHNDIYRLMSLIGTECTVGWSDFSFLWNFVESKTDKDI